VLGLIRVSKERDGTISPETQLAAITEYCTSRGYDIVGWLEGLDESGSRLRSPWWAKLDQAVDRVETGDVDGIVVWRFSRTARHRLKWATALHRVDNSGGFLEAAQEQFDTTTAIGRLARGMTGEFNAFQAELIGESWKEAHAHRIKAGRPANGKPRFGYRYDAEQKLHVPDPDTGPVLADMYRRYVAGETVYDLVRWLNAHGWRTTNAGLWSDRTLRRVLDSGFATGRFMAGGDVKRGVAPTLHPGVHQPLIDDDLWQTYLDAREVRRGRSPRSERSQYLLSGMVRCARCGGSMVAGQFGAGRAPKYRCKTGKEIGPAACSGGYVMAALVEGHVQAWLTERAAAVDQVAETANGSSAHRASLAAQEKVLVRQITTAERALANLTVQKAKEQLREREYQAARQELLDELTGLEASLELVQRDARRAPEDVTAVAAGLLEEWDETPVVVRREVLRRLVDCVLVTTGRPRARFRVVEAWEVRPGGGSL